MFLKNLCSLKIIKLLRDINFSSKLYDVGLVSRGKGQRQQRPCSQLIRCSVSYFFLISLLNSKLFYLNFLLNHFSKQSAAHFNSVLNILETTILFFLSATASAQSLNCSSVLLSLKLSCSRVR